MKAAPITPEKLAIWVASQQARHADPNSFEGRRRTQKAFKRWRCKLPPGLAPEEDAPLLVARHRDYWLWSASWLVRSLDPCGLGARSFHAVDVGGFGIVDDRTLGFTVGGLFDLARPLLPRTAARGPVVALNLRELAFRTLVQEDDQDEPTVRERVRFSTGSVALHEAAHVVADRGPDQSLETDLPTDKVFGILAQAATRQDPPARVVASHGRDWVRAYAHLASRAVRHPGAEYWLRIFEHDVAAVFPGSAADWLDALAPELATTQPDEPIVQILDRPPPARFDALCEERSAA